MGSSKTLTTNFDFLVAALLRYSFCQSPGFRSNYISLELGVIYGNIMAGDREISVLTLI